MWIKDLRNYVTVLTSKMVGRQVKADRIDIHRDAGLAVIIILPVFVALKPLMFHV